MQRQGPPLSLVVAAQCWAKVLPIWTLVLLTTEAEVTTPASRGACVEAEGTSGLAQHPTSSKQAGRPLTFPTASLKTTCERPGVETIGAMAIVLIAGWCN